MEETLFFNTRDLPVQLHLTILTSFRKGEQVSITGYDPEKPNTVYFSLEQNVKLKTLILPMPISPKNLAVSISSNFPFSIHYARIGMIYPSKKILRLGKQTKRFIRHTFDFAEAAGYLRDGNTYSNDSGKFPVHYYPVISHTPARIHKESGHIEVSASHFRSYTVPMRVFILLHEWMHWVKNTGNEVKCDIEAAKLFLGLGFPRYEALVAVTEVLTDHPEHIQRAESLQKFIKEYSA